ncbi:hypothetical protein BH09PAT2_BH09PAT2_10610 [soil metagenome]
MKDNSFVDYILQDVLSHIPGISSRAMFGGHGIYKDGVIFGLIANDVLYFKVGESNISDYEKAGSQPFTYSKKDGKATAMSYWGLPESVFEKKEELNEWVQKAVHASIESKKKK